MKPIARSLLERGAPLPILSFPAAALLGVTVKELLSSAEMQAKGMAAIARRCPAGAVLNMMNLSVEADSFGAELRAPENEVPTVARGVIGDIAEAADLAVPDLRRGQAPVCIEGIRRAAGRVEGKPLFCGAIGPYSLAGRLFGMSELMMACFDDADATAVLLDKASEFILSYISACRDAGADGVILAEPAAGLLSPPMAAEFSTPYVRRIFEALDRDDFFLCYHNCGRSVTGMAEDLASLPADAFHFGNAVVLSDLLDALPRDRIVMGNVDPLLLVDGTPERVRDAVRGVRDACGKYPNFLLSTGCDVPAAAKWENIDAFFDA